jgi:hypothetical protein
MKLVIRHQEKYSRGELLLRTFLGWLYICIPHWLLLVFAGLWSLVLLLVAFWVIVFTGSYPEPMFRYQAGFLKWLTRVQARMLNLSDGYPAFWIRGTDDHTDLEVPYPGKVRRGLTVARLLFGIFYVEIPHGLFLMFRGIFVGILLFVAWWVVLVTARFPERIHAWAVGQIRWQLRVYLYMMFMTDRYPPFTGDEVPGERAGVPEGTVPQEEGGAQERIDAPGEPGAQT